MENLEKALAARAWLPDPSLAAVCRPVSAKPRAPLMTAQAVTALRQFLTARNDMLAAFQDMLEAGVPFDDATGEAEATGQAMQQLTVICRSIVL